MINIDGNVAHLSNGKLSYILEVDEKGNLLNRHFGKPVKKYNGSGIQKHYRRGFATQHDNATVSYDSYPFEFPVKSNGDFRIPALTVRHPDGMRDLSLSFKDWEIIDEKPIIPGLPSVRSDNETETLKVTLEDKKLDLEIELYYTIYENLGIITRFNKITNKGDLPIFIENFQSASLELPQKDYEMLTLYGAHTKEANQNRFPLHHGIQRVESSRGVSSHHAQPFMALMTPETNYDNGEVYGLNLVYSGNFEAATELDTYKNVRSQIGINSEIFEWVLEPGESFYTPEAVLNYSSEGLNKMAQNFHTLYQDHLIPKEFEETRPLLFNSWEGTYFDVSEEKVKRQAEIIKDLGMELYVLDDGWFRNGSKEGMGDWEVIEEKLPNGIDGVADIVHDLGLKFGLWFEPEAIGEISKAILAHPEWVLKLRGYPSTTGRHEFILDLSRKEVQDYIVDFMSRYLDKGNIDYVKWDMNRPLTDYFSDRFPPEKQGEVAHRYVLGLYEIYDQLRKKYPEVLIEGCASGGGRFDPGILSFSPQVWTSDNTDAVDRIAIQEGTSLLYPPVSMGSHVSVAPNHQTGRYTSLKTRFDMARLFNFGYEIDVTQLNDEELEEIKKQIEEYKEDRDWLQKATFYHHDLNDDNYHMWSSVSKDLDKAMAVIFQRGFEPLSSTTRFRFRGLDPDAQYEIEETGEVFGGDELMEIGITVPLVYEDFHTFTRKLNRVS